jgi:hypothetical protein
MKQFYFSALVFCTLTSAQAVELVCRGDSPRNPQQRAITVDCSDRKAVIDTLGAAWQTLRKQGIGGSTENMCWDPYQTAQEMHPSISFNGIAQTFFMQCNMALQYVK